MYSQCDLPEIYWRLLEVVLVRLDPPRCSTTELLELKTKRYYGLMHLVAARNLLEFKDHFVYLPEWLSLHLLSTSFLTERAIDLLRLYVVNGRVFEAYGLATDMIEAAIGNRTDPSAFGLRVC